ncbi:MAG: serine/threonine protein kinase [Planctomycetes bacterium]|nr:serine/threonine protein kinase [Planctomycetota bacterium]MBM4079140.1 serine/threonine protein kinase [Planctomycetota bacterium]MBM4083590.1 serine/threonine protein kinase [Planctomycetota bacterium]
MARELANVTGASRYLIPGFEILRQTASGGFSTIYKAWDETRQIVVALKVLNEVGGKLAAFLDEGEDTRWEGEIAMSLKHPNIIQTYECGKKGGRYYLAMEYISCVKAKYLCPVESPRELADRLRILMQVVEALTYVHDKGLLYRDVCVGNVLVDRKLTAKLIDFGLTVPKAQGSVYHGKAGTPSYMAPEMIRTEQADERTDIYSFGVLMYEFLTGKKPFKAEDKFSRMVRSLNVNPAPMTRFSPSVSPQLQAIVSRAMEKETRRRYQSMSEVRNALLALTQTHP